LEIMKLIPDKSIDMILADLPYGTTACKWDTIIPFEPLWEQYKRIIKDSGAIILTASQPFTSALVSSNYKLFKYCLVWDKIRKTGHLDAKRKPLKRHEDICIFYKKLPTYNPQMVKGENHLRGSWAKSNKKCEVYNEFKNMKGVLSDEYYPDSILNIRQVLKAEHPTQKPAALFEYLIKTYTNEGDIILDNVAGSGTTGVAAENTGRHSIMIERDPKYCNIILDRMSTLDAGGFFMPKRK